MTPISLLTSITATRSTRSSSSLEQVEVEDAVCPDRQEGGHALPASHSAVSSTAACSVATVRMRLRAFGALSRPSP